MQTFAQCKSLFVYLAIVAYYHTTKICLGDALEHA